MATPTTMVAWLGWRRETPVSCLVEDVGCGAGRTTCFECGGTGDWTPFMPEPPPEPVACVDCKGTGVVLVSV